MNMKKRTLLYIQGTAYALSAVFMLIMLIGEDFSDIDWSSDIGWFALLIIIALVLGFMAFRDFKKIKQVGEDELAYDPAEYAPPKDATEEELASYYKRGIIF
jgi:hypothetical protein